jgi:hypothetical protein
MTLRRPPAVDARTIMHRAGPSFVSHHHRRPALHLGVTMQVVLVLPSLERTPAGLTRPGSAPSAPRPILRTALAYPRAERGGPGSLPGPARPPRVSPTVLRPTVGFATGDGDPGARAVTTVTTVRREERVRLETVVRRATPETASAPTAAAPRPPGHPSEPPESPRAPRGSTPPAAAVPPAIPESEVARLTERVVQRIRRRIVTERERMGGR